ncbi:hypothetical protein CPB84DRAFT_1694640, partial [Gymnopilus junonius]
PNSLPDAVQEFLGSALNLCDEYVQGCWDVFKSTIWHYDPVQHSTVADAMLFQEHGKQQNLASHSLYPPVTTCLNPSCLKDMALLHDYAKTPRKVILFTLEDGAYMTYHYKLTCTTCKTMYHNNYLVSNHVRTYYAGVPDVIEIGKHQFILRDVANMFLNLMLISWTSASNCMTIYNESLSKPENWPKEWDFIILSNGITIGHPCCGVRHCTESLENVKRDQFCPGHKYRLEICAVEGCEEKVVPDFLTCALASHRELEEKRKLHNSTNFQLQSQVQRSTVSNPPDEEVMQSLREDGEALDDGIEEKVLPSTAPQEPMACPQKLETGNQCIRACFGHSQTHNEQLLVHPCGMIVA